jgi:polar amino acid transport system substrate-binding protein
MKHVSRYLAISIVLLLFSMPAISQQVLSAIVKKGEIRIGMTGNQPPFSMKSKSGELIGYEVDLANALATNMGVKLKLVEMPFSELMGALKAGKGCRPRRVDGTGGRCGGHSSFASSSGKSTLV